MPLGPDFLLAIPVLAFSIVAHECAHGAAALALGDPTAREKGRLTLNPLPHLDLAGSLLVPAAIALLRAPVWIAWAKPAPLDPARLRQPRDHVAWVALAGPACHAALALGFALAARLTPGDGAWEPVRAIAVAGVTVNCGLLLFHLLPLPPLDGSRVLMRLLPLRHSFVLASLRVPIAAALAVALAVPPVARVLFGAPVEAAASLCFAAVGLPAGGGAS